MLIRSGVIALVSAAILYVASKKFAVYEDPRIAQVAEVLPQEMCIRDRCDGGRLVLSHVFLQRGRSYAPAFCIYGYFCQEMCIRDSYKSIREALSQAGTYNDRKVSVDFVNSEKLTDENVTEALKGMAGVLIGPGSVSYTHLPRKE